MRVVLVTHFYPAHGGGIEIVAARLAERMAASGVRLVWCASDVDPPPAITGVDVDPMRAWNGVERMAGRPYPLWSPASLMRLARHVRAADAVHLHDGVYFGSLAAALFARRSGRRLVVSQHVGAVPLPAPLQAVYTLAQRAAARVLRSADGVGFVSPVVQAHFERIAGPLPHARQVANGVDDRVFAPPPASFERGAARAALGFDAARPLLAFVGRFVPVKRLPIVRAIAALRPDWQWCIVGAGPEQPADWGLPNVRVLAPMAQPALADVYRAADLLLLPSASEGFPLVVQEAMACGLPACITAAVAAGAELPRALWIELPEAGADTAARGAAVIAGWLATPPAEQTARRNACVAHARQAWSWDAAAAVHLQWLRGVSD